jgi:GntR family transcriptional regulator
VRVHDHAGRDAKALDAEAESSVLEVIRWYLDSHGRLFEISENIHPAGRYVVTSVLKRVRQAEGFSLSQA